jgi:1,4-dihydroxy-2-naphthoate polyprenyltransferase
MSRLKGWIQAARLRTLPLAAVGTLLGLAALLRLSPEQEGIEMRLLFLMLTALGLQVLSNFANDYGDFHKGTDNSLRVGPGRALQTGSLRPIDLLRAIWVCGGFAMLSGLVLLWLNLGDLSLQVLAGFFVLGLAAIWAAVQYTVGKRAYGYRGLGDVFVFVFFGPVAVWGSYLLLGGPVNEAMALWPGLGLGFFAVGVLHMNNMRDVENDASCGKITLAVRLGSGGGKLYHVLILSIGISAWLYGLKYSNCTGLIDLQYLSIGPGIVMALLQGVLVIFQKKRAGYDRLLKLMVLVTLLTALGYILPAMLICS